MLRMYVHTCLSADTQDCWSLLAIWETIKLMAADVVAIRLGEKVREGGGFASSLQTWRGGQPSESKTAQRRAVRQRNVMLCI